MSGRNLARRPIGATLAACALAVTLAAPVAADDPSVSIQAEHGAVFDPLFGMETGTGLWSRRVDEWTRMASTTKVMTAVVVLDLVDEGQVDLGEPVTFSFDAATTGGSALVDTDGAKVRAGEVIELNDLLYGLMIHSGNNAAIAIAEQVSSDVYTVVDVDSFVYLMNLKADTLGLDDTVFTNPSGFALSDLNGHHTTARDLARLWTYAMRDSRFVDLVRPRPTSDDAWAFEGTMPGGAKTTYALWNDTGVLGAEGWKNGGKNGCGIGGSNESDAECFVTSAERLGRRLVATGFQSVGSVSGGTGDPKEILDLGFARLFHPQARGASALAGAASRHALACPTSGRALSAVIRSTGRTRLVSWATAVGAGTYSRLGTGVAVTGLLAEASTSRDVDLLALTSSRAVTATRIGTSTELRLWNVPSSGAPSVIGTAVGTTTTGPARSMELVRLDGTTFATVAVTVDRKLAIKTWRRTTTGLIRLAAVTYTYEEPIGEIDVARSALQDRLGFVVLTTPTSGPASTVSSFEVGATSGSVSFRDSTTVSRMTGASLVAVPSAADAGREPPARYAVVGAENGRLTVFDRAVAADGRFILGFAVKDAGGSYSSVEAAGFGSSGLVAAVRMNDGTLKLIVWEGRANTIASSSYLRIATHQTAIVGSEIEACSTPNALSEGDLITAAREGAGSDLRIRGWRIAPRPLIPAGG